MMTQYHQSPTKYQPASYNISCASGSWAVRPHVCAKRQSSEI